MSWNSSACKWGTRTWIIKAYCYGKICLQNGTWFSENSILTTAGGRVAPFHHPRCPWSGLQHCVEVHRHESKTWRDGAGRNWKEKFEDKANNWAVRKKGGSAQVCSLVAWDAKLFLAVTVEIHCVCFWSCRASLSCLSNSGFSLLKPCKQLNKRNTKMRNVWLST